MTTAGLDARPGATVDGGVAATAPMLRRNAAAHPAHLDAGPAAAAPREAAAALPLGFGVEIDPGVRHHPGDAGGVLLGGSPLRVLRLNPAAWAQFGRLSAGAPVDNPAAARVAGRLIDCGLAHPRPPQRYGDLSEVTVVIPAHGRVAALRRCLRSVGPAASVLVVDDASPSPDQVAEVTRTAGATVYRRGRNGGPAAARNSGLARCHTPFVAFVDSDCVPEPGWLSRLLPYFADPAVAAVAPRVIGLDAPGTIGGYESARSALDLGPRPGPIRPRSRISYVPAAALVVRRSALDALPDTGLHIPPGKRPDTSEDTADTRDGAERTAHAFREELRVGEDVDLLWRLHAAGWRLRYVPAVRVRHEHRVAPAAWAARKFAYGTSAGPLARRHPGLVPPAVTSVVALLPLALLRSGRPAAALATGAMAAAGLARRLPPFPGRSAAAIRLMASGCLTTGYGLATAATRAWLPLTVALAVRRPATRGTLAVGILAASARTWWLARPRLDPLRWLLGYLLDDACYCAGIWVGAVRAGTAAPLLPAVPEFPRWKRPRTERGNSHHIFPGTRPGMV